MVILYVVIAIILSIILILLSKIRIFLEYKKYPGEKLYTNVSLSVGFVKLDKLIYKKLNKKQSEKKEKISKSQEEKDKSFIKKIKDYTKTFEISKKVYSKNRWRIQKKLIVENADFHLKFGLFDAAQTGIATGTVWTMLYSALAFLDTVGTVKNHFFEVVPVFTEPGFISEGRIKLSVRLINAISIGLRLYLTYTKISKDTK